MENSKDTGKLIGALLLGAIIGGAVGLLLASEKGSEIGKKVIAKSDELTEAIAEKLNDFLAHCKKEAEASQSEIMNTKKPADG